LLLILGQQRPAIAFTALLSKTTNVNAKGVVKYDHVLTNLGGVYQPTTGVFTAPYNGLYSISCSLMSDESETANVRIMKNGIKMAQIYSASETYPHAGQTLHLVLNKDNRMWIENVHSREAKLYDHKSFNAFSGVLITEL
jgi:hypothetical protein